MINREAVSRVLDNMTPAEWESFQFHFEQAVAATDARQRAFSEQMAKRIFTATQQRRQAQSTR